MPRFTYVLPFLLMLLCTTCAQAPRITFTGVSIDPNVESFSVENFYNDAPDGPADLGIRFTESMREYFQRNTPLNQITGAGDLQFAGSITGYNVTPVAAGAGEFQGAQLQRLTITVSVDYINLYDEESSFDRRSFSFFQDFDANQTLAQVEDQLITEIFDQVIFDIFNATVADW